MATENYPSTSLAKSSMVGVNGEVLGEPSSPENQVGSHDQLWAVRYARKRTGSDVGLSEVRRSKRPRQLTNSPSPRRPSTYANFTDEDLECARTLLSLRDAVSSPRHIYDGHPSGIPLYVPPPPCTPKDQAPGESADPPSATLSIASSSASTSSQASWGPKREDTEEWLEVVSRRMMKYNVDIFSVSPGDIQRLRDLSDAKDRMVSPSHPPKRRRKSEVELLKNYLRLKVWDPMAMAAPDPDLITAQT